MNRPWLRNTFALNNTMLVAGSRRSSARKRSGARLAVEALEGRAVPAFLTPVSYSAGSGPGGIAVGDFNGDGRDDMAVVNTNGT